MNATHLHLIFTHLLLACLGFALLVNLYAIYRKNPDILKLSLLLYILVGITALLSYMTGDGAEEIIKTYPGITEDLIEPHEHFALAFFIGLMLLSCLSLFSVIYTAKKEALVKRSNQAIVILAVILCILAVETALTGGNIRHSEFNNGAYKEIPKN